MNGAIEAKTRLGWVRLAPDSTPPRVLETDDIQLRGLDPAETITIGPCSERADSRGEIRLRPLLDDNLRGHVGHVEVHTATGHLLGEVELVPDKLSEAAYLELRADLQRVWTNLVLDPDGVTTVRAQPPSAHDLWARLEGPARQIIDRPNEQLVIGDTIQRLERVKRLNELRPSVVRAGQRGRAAMTRGIQRTTDTPENHLLGVTLRLLRAQARRDGTATDLVHRLDTLLTDSLFNRAREPIRALTWGMRSDSRYRQVLAVHQVLNRPEFAATEGPGELRLGVPALTRLYEYWVYLQVLLAARERYGPPEPPGFEVLSVVQQRGGRRLELRPGTTVTFPGPVHIAFEPPINTRGDGWMQLVYVPHPDPRVKKLAATPDVVVFRADRTPWVTIIDAKYVGRTFVELEAARLHEKYARMRWHGVPVVRNVIAAHPHAGLGRQWAGYGHTCLAPRSIGVLPLPLPSGDVVLKSADVAPDRAPPEETRRSDDSPPGTPISVVADQYWMHRELGGRRIDLGSLRTLVAAGRPVRHSEMVMPGGLPALKSFGSAAERLGWRIHWTESTDRASQIARLLELVVERLQDGAVAVISGDTDVVGQLPSGQIVVFDSLDAVPAL